MEEFYLKVYLFKPNRVPPIKIAKDSQLKITIETMDYTIPPGATASAFANGVTSEKVYTQSCTVSGNKVSFTPVPGFFVRGRNLLQYEIAGGVIPLAIDVNCEISLPTTGETAEPETVKPMVQRAEEAAATAEEKANAAAGSAGAAAGSAAAAGQSAQAAREALEKTQAISVNPSYIGENGNWFVWSTALDSYVDSGVPAQGPKGDPGAVTPEQLNAAVRKAAPRNLLDNSDFRNPVNQRGQTSYELGSWGGYTIDRWFAGPPGCAINLESDGLVLSGDLVQAISSDVISAHNGKTMTFAINVGGTVYACTGTVNQCGAWNRIGLTNTSAGVISFETESNDDMFICIGNTSAAKIMWAALYEGTYTVETLPEYQPKGYGAELAECQRYYQIRSTNNIAAVDMRPTMRLSSPTITSVTGGYAYYADL